MTEEQVYRNFITWCSKTWWELPDSEYLVPMITANYSPDEAGFLTGFPHGNTSLEDLAVLKGLSAEELMPLLDELCRKGMIYKAVRGDSVRYRLNDTFFALMRARFWPGETDDQSQKTAAAVNKYFLDNWFDQYNQVHHRGLRTLPIAQTIQDDRTIIPFEDAVKVVEGFVYYSVSTCPCRHRHNLDPDMPDCPHPAEVCLHFDELGRYTVEHNMGREITKEETLEILKKSADSGLVHGISTWKEHPDTICNCCSCCCMWLESYHKLGHSKSLDPSNYLVKVNPESCRACGLCQKRCPMDALQLKYSARTKNKYSKAPVVDPDICLGCGVCVHKCPTQSIVLQRRSEIKKPPVSARDYMQGYRTDRLEALKREAV
jgi:electron transport complex protein RnfB